MAGETMTAKAVLTADGRQFARTMREAGGSMQSLQQTAGRTAQGISTAMRFATGFGILAAIRQADALLEGFHQRSQARAVASAQAVARGVSGSGPGESESGRLATEASTGARAGLGTRLNTSMDVAMGFVGSMLAEINAAVAGGAEGVAIRAEAAESMARLTGEMERLANETSTYREDLIRLSVNQAKYEEALMKSTLALEGPAMQAEMGDQWRALVGALSDGITKAEGQAARKFARDVQAKLRTASGASVFGD